MGTFTAIFDACVLYPAPLRDLLMYLARTNLFRARWTDRIHDEWIQALLRTRPELHDKLQRTRELMNRAVPDALVEGYEELIERLRLPDPDDRHVLAAAIRGRADVIVTSNLRDFPPDALSAYGIEAQHPDEFVRYLVDLDRASVCAAIKRLRDGLKRPPMSAEVYLEKLRAVGMVRSVDALWSCRMVL